MTKRMFSYLQFTLMLVVPLFSSCADGQQKSTKESEGASISSDTTGRSSHSSPEQLVDYANVLKGKFVLEGSNCAGLDFINNETVTWTNEIACDMPDTLVLFWTDASTFVVRTKERVTDGCPPRADIYKVKSFNGADLTLINFWTGWGGNKSEDLTFKKMQ